MGVGTMGMSVGVGWLIDAGLMGAGSMGAGGAGSSMGAGSMGVGSIVRVLLYRLTREMPAADTARQMNTVSFITLSTLLWRVFCYEKRIRLVEKIKNNQFECFSLCVVRLCSSG